MYDYVYNNPVGRMCNILVGLYSNTIWQSDENVFYKSIQNAAICGWCAITEDIFLSERRGRNKRICCFQHDL